MIVANDATFLVIASFGLGFAEVKGGGLSSKDTCLSVALPCLSPPPPPCSGHTNTCPLVIIIGLFSGELGPRKELFCSMDGVLCSMVNGLGDAMGLDVECPEPILSNDLLFLNCLSIALRMYLGEFIPCIPLCDEYVSVFTVGDPLLGNPVTGEPMRGELTNGLMEPNPGESNTPGDPAGLPCTAHMLSIEVYFLLLTIGCLNSGTTVFSGEGIVLGGMLVRDLGTKASGLGSSGLVIVLGGTFVLVFGTKGSGFAQPIGLGRSSMNGIKNSSDDLRLCSIGKAFGTSSEERLRVNGLSGYNLGGFLGGLVECMLGSSPLIVLMLYPSNHRADGP